MPQVYFLRGILGRLTSTGLDQMAGELRKYGITASVEPHSYYPAMTSRILRERRKKVIMVGHSQGANRCMTSAFDLQRAGEAVDLLICLCPVGTTWRFPPNVRTAMNFYTGTWGNYVPVEDPNKTALLNFDYSNDWTVWHTNIDQKPNIQNTILSAIYRELGTTS